MTRRMADTTEPANAPDGFDMYAGYINGALIRPSFPGLVARFGRAKVRSISTNGDPGVVAEIYDFERGDYTPGQAVEVRRRNPGGTFYANRSDWAQIAANLHAAGLSLPTWFAATLDGTQHVAGAAIVQWIDRGPYDESIIYDDGWYPSIPQEEDFMIWGADTSDTNMRIVDGRCATIRQWWHDYRGPDEITQAQQQAAYQMWATRGADLCLAGIIDRTIT